MRRVSRRVTIESSHVRARVLWLFRTPPDRCQTGYRKRDRDIELENEHTNREPERNDRSVLWLVDDATIDAKINEALFDEPGSTGLAPLSRVTLARRARVWKENRFPQSARSPSPGHETEPLLLAVPSAVRRVRLPRSRRPRGAAVAGGGGDHSRTCPRVLESSNPRRLAFPSFSSSRRFFKMKTLSSLYSRRSRRRRSVSSARKPSISRSTTRSSRTRPPSRTRSRTSKCRS